MKVFIANVSKQNHILAYRRPGLDKMQEPEIKSGTQIMIEGDKPVLETILKGFRKFGVIEANEVGRNPAFSGIAYQFDRPLNVERLKEAADKRGEIEDQRSQDQREAMTAATDAQINQVASEVGLPEVKTVVEFEEKKPQGSPGKAVKQKLQIDRNRPRTASA